MPKHIISMQITRTGETIPSTLTVENDTEAVVDVTLAANAVNQLVTLNLVRVNIKSLVLQAVSGDVTIKTNSSSAPDDTEAMVAGTVIVYAPDTNPAVGVNPFASADVTALYLSSVAGTVFKLRAILNQSTLNP